MRSTTFVLTLALLTALPTAALAGWGGKGSAEPDTKEDRTQGWMFQNADQSAAGERVYFNGIMGQEVGYLPSVGTSINPNVATVGTAHQTYPYHARAILGVWKDCNKDNMIGFGDNGLFEYRTELLLNDYSVCPIKPLAPMAPTDHSGYLVHNDGTWVREFISLGYDTNPATQPDQNQYNLNDYGSRVWVDDGRPTDAPVGTCYTTNHPMGTYHSVGGIVNLSDCYGSRKFTDAIGVATRESDQNITHDSTASGAWLAVKGTRNPWGEETDASDATVWDCHSARLVDQQVSGSTWLTVSQPSSSPGVGTSGSPAGTANATGSGLSSDCTTNYHADHSNPGQEAAHAPYSLESDQVQNQIDVRVQSDFTMRFAESKRPGPTSVSQLGGRQTPNDAGLGQPIYSEGFWGGGGVRAVSYNPYVDRRTLDPQSVTYLTFYAYVSPGAITKYSLILPKVTSGTYGAEACGTFTTGIHSHWDCDRTHWYPADSMPREPFLGTGPDGQSVAIGMRPGDPFTLRDTDCYDESIAAARAQGIGYGVLSGTACTP